MDKSFVVNFIGEALLMASSFALVPKVSINRRLIFMYLTALAIEFISMA